MKCLLEDGVVTTKQRTGMQKIVDKYVLSSIIRYNTPETLDGIAIDCEGNCNSKIPPLP
jgi:hypothetical protein